MNWLALDIILFFLSNDIFSRILTTNELTDDAQKIYANFSKHDTRRPEWLDQPSQKNRLLA